ncbi:PQQ-binding-like beta-propeller repeat protein [Micromonospora sp. DT31]|uniref:outer membrane protein assembly factor BamB family protein n=1 Tax=Micromonospora sp. DT31 TaxID=3393434 RepID=UPI003CE849C5
MAHALPDDSLVVAGRGEPDDLPGVVLGPDGKPRWSILPGDGFDIIAISDRTLVTVNDCSKSGCRYVGRNLADGTIIWTVTAGLGPEHAATNLTKTAWISRESGPSFNTAWFATKDASGAGQLRSADTGAVLRSYLKGHYVWRAGDAALIIGPGTSGCSLEIVRTGRTSPPPAPVDCALHDSISGTFVNEGSGRTGYGTPGHGKRGYGMFSGDMLWSETTKSGSAYAVDLNTGAVLTVAAYWPRSGRPADTKGEVSILGDGVRVVATRDAVVTRDAATGKSLWRLDVPADQVYTLAAEGRLVVVVQKQPELFLEGLFVPGYAGLAVRAFDARSGELRYQARGPSTLEAPIIVGDRMMTELVDRDGRTRRWLFTPSG